MASRDLRVTLIGRDETGPAFGSASRGATGLQTRFAAIGSAVGNLAANGISAGLSAITNFAGGAVAAFAAVEDATGAAGVQFGSALPKVLAFAEAASKGFGISKREALEAQNTFGTFGKAAGMTEGDLAGFSQKLTGLAGDLASFKGTSVEQAIQAIGSALKGEADPIEAFGVQMNEAAIKAEALSQGLIKTTKDALTPQQKTLAVSALLFKQTKDAQGDYARTSEGTANTQKTLAAEMENAQVILGEKLAPAMTVVRQVMLGLVQGAGGLIGALAPVASAVTQVVEALLTGNFSGGFLDEDSKVIDVVFRVREAIQAMVPVVQGLATELVDRLSPAVSTVVGFIRDHLQPILTVVSGVLGGVLLSALVSVAGILLGPVVAAVGAFVAVLASPVVLIGALVGALVYAYNNFEGFREVVDRVAAFITGTVIPAFMDLAQKVQEYVGAAVEAVKANWPEIQEVIERVLAAVQTFISTWVTVLTELWQRFGDNILDAITIAFDLIKSNVEAAMTVIQGVIQTISALIRGDWAGVWDGIQQIVDGVWKAISGIVEAAMKAIQALVATGLEALKGAWDLAWAAIGKVVDTTWTAIKNGISGAWDGIKGALSSAVSTVKDAFVGYMSAYGDAVSSAWSSIKDGISGAWSTIGRTLKSAASSALDGLLELMQALPGKVTGALGDVGSLLFNAGRSIVQGLIDGITDKIGALARKMGELAQTAKDFLPFSPAKRGPLAGKGNPFYSGQSIASLLADGLQAGRPTVAGAMAAVASDVGDLAGMRLGGSDFIHRRIAAAGQSPAPIGGADGALLAELRAIRDEQAATRRVLAQMPDDYRLAERSR